MIPARQRAAVADDILSLVCGMLGVFSWPRVEVRLDLTDEQSCPKFHCDNVLVRLVTTYVGPGTHVPETEEYGISSRVFRARRPLHPQRFWDLITGPAFKGMIRSKGFLWLATRPDWAGVWSSAGAVSSLQPGGSWLASAPEEDWPEELDRDEINEIWEEPWGDRRQELVIIGAKLADDLLDRLEARCLTDDEMNAGPVAWLDLPDPFPAWRIATDGDDEALGDTIEV